MAKAFQLFCKGVFPICVFSNILPDMDGFEMQLKSEKETRNSDYFPFSKNHERR